MPVEYEWKWSPAEAEHLMQTAREVLEDAMDAVASQAINYIAIEAPVDEGKLHSTGSWIYSRMENFSRKVTSLLSYSGYVQEGTGPAVGHQPYTPPFDVIEAWAYRHKLPAYPIWLHIARYGTKPNPYVTRAMALIEKHDFTPEIQHAMKRRGVL